MFGQGYPVKANKSKLYELVKRHFEIPVECGTTTFFATSWGYNLRFLFDGCLYRFDFRPKDGRAALVRTMQFLNGKAEQTSDTAYIEHEELLELGMARAIR